MLEQKVAEAKLRLTQLLERKAALNSQRRSASLRIMSRSNAVVWEKAKQQYRHKLDEHGMRLVSLIGALFAALVLPFAFFAAIFDWLTFGMIASCFSITATIIVYRIVLCGSDERTFQRIRHHEVAKAEASREKEETGFAISAVEHDIKIVLSQLSELEPELARHLAFEEEERRKNEFDNLSKNLFNERWKELRGIDFEKYVKRVFEHLGYETEETPVTGDQGVDLVVISAGRRMAIQIKGYFNSVSNSAVQEVVAGMKFYHCYRSCVVTNSRFTASAIDLANANDCKCVGEDNFEDFIYGRVFPRVRTDAL